VSAGAAPEGRAITFLTTRGNRRPIRAYLRTAGAPLRGLIRPLDYDRFLSTREHPPGTYVFADLELLSDAERARAAEAWEALAARGARLLNHPARSLRRYDLLRLLEARGINRFAVHRAEEGPAPARFPVFLREESGHGGSDSPLLETQEALSAALLARRRERGSLAGTLVVEHLDTADARGVYRKYGAFIVGERILARHLFFSDRWQVKDWHLLDEGRLEEERRFVEENLHAGALRPIFALAGIEYGRIDYALLDGAVQVWEINTNPMIAGVGPPRPGGRASSGLPGRMGRRGKELLESLLWHVPALDRARAALAPSAPRPRAAVHASFAAALRAAWGALLAPATSSAPSPGTSASRR
jgi:hypothetical protein